MSQAERDQFDAVLDELRGLLLDLEMIGVDVVLVGGQVIALEAPAPPVGTASSRCEPART